MKKMNLPNKLTISRLIMIPVFVFFMLFEIIYPWNYIIAVIIFALASLTDVADGYLARKNNQVTDFGKFLDPIADKLLVFSALISMVFVFTKESMTMINDTYGDVFNIFLFIASVIVLFRELLVTSLRLVVVSSEEKIVIPANRLGKTKTGTQDLFIIYAILFRVFLPLDIYYIIGYVLLSFMVVFTVLSGYSYVKAYSKYIDPNK